MKGIIDRFEICLDRFGVQGRYRQWAWFAALWLFGLVSVSCLGYAIKIAMRMI